jgi:hypothetical protein
MRWMLPLLVVTLSTPILAVDGVLEINQSCAELTGCVPGDTPGFPVTISAPGSYRLTGNLTLPDQNATGILVKDDNVSIDLGGFGIMGPVFCQSSAGGVFCSPVGTGIGVLSELSLFPPSGTAVRNGFVRGMGSVGIRVRENSRVDGVLIEHCAGGGIEASDGSLVLRSQLQLNGTVGLAGQGGTVTFQGNSIARIGGPTVTGATEIGGNTCDDARCSAVLCHCKGASRIAVLLRPPQPQRGQGIPWEAHGKSSGMITFLGGPGGRHEA